MSARGGSADRDPAARSAAARRGWEARKRLALTRAAASADAAPERGSQVDRVLRGAEIGALIRRTLDSLRERDA